MKRSLIALSLTLATSPFLLATEQAEYQSWVGGFVERYIPDSEKPDPIGYLKSGWGLGGEYGYRFKPEWAVRLEASRLDLGVDKQKLGINNPDDKGWRYGVDALYFAENDALYLFAGLKQETVGADATYANIGLGKHWHIKDNWRVITEAAMYRDFDDGLVDYGLKLGVAYTFGGKGAGATRDADGDGVADAQDNCPGTATGTPVDSMGCSLDSDNDGVLNNLDNCPNSPAGSKVDARGCAIDSDSDGIADVRDQCPSTPKGHKVDARGCSLDSDNDGVVNSMDSCPDTPAGVKVGAKGCSLSIDSDQDGVRDSADQCADTPMTDKVDSKGCSIFEDKEVAVRLEVLFGNNSAEVANPDSAQFQEFADFMQRFPNTKTVIEGHSSAVGNAAYNLQISQRRADAVRDLLVSRYGVDADRISTIGYGETRLLDTSNTAQAHKLNRRIEAKVTANEQVKAHR